MNKKNGSYCLIDFLSSSICNGSLYSFEGKIYAQNDKLISEDIYKLPLMEIIQMNWLLNNIIGKIPPIEAFKQDVQSLIRLQGVKSTNKMLFKIH